MLSSQLFPALPKTYAWGIAFRPTISDGRNENQGLGLVSNRKSLLVNTL